ncbi:hypothetical protein DFP92_1215 [Yoonia sediminilitoris]|uniref:Uncharacterized protein n=1 Tax=Yoonia sediminilitoris TaxID=1286148 RepID=A0A2T6K661_9RHOB|nr:hypothetical protein C8N45_1215 [Yoonia sediminilitoris]RCW89671.1 hypothetical protein DFP92_1215 [Yoonia sediminilitoris]
MIEEHTLRHIDLSDGWFVGDDLCRDLSWLTDKPN